MGHAVIYDNDRPSWQLSPEKYRVIMDGTAETISERSRWRLPRRLAYRAGTAKMENGLFDLVWAAMIQLIGQVLEPACVELACRQSPANNNDKQTIDTDKMERMRDIAPLPFLVQTEKDYQEFLGHLYWSSCVYP